LFQDTIDAKRVGPIVLAIAALCAALVGGCSNSQSTTSLGALPPRPAPKTAASGPAISDKLSIDQLALESKIERVTHKTGVVYLHFNYADRDGKVYKCELPQAMAQGQYSPQEWNRTFNIYRLPKVIKQKKMPEGPDKKRVVDYPFISPNPQAVQSERRGETGAGASGAPSSP